MFNYFADFNPKTFKMTDDLANVLVDWANFNGFDVKRVHSTSSYHVVVLDVDLEEYPYDLLSAIGEDFYINFHSEMTPNYIRLIPISEHAKSQILGSNYFNWDKYFVNINHATWEGEP